jgi:polyketide cyclase/dehydrase/lipid transport protein
MASIHHEITVQVDAARAWQALRAVGDAHKLFAPVLVDGRLEGDTRTVTFANGMIVRERILDVDDRRRRVAYTVLDGPGMSYHHASMRIVEAGQGQCAFVWITDFLPEELRASLTPLIEQGSRALKAQLEA